jgi:hypothetical protein
MKKLIITLVLITALVIPFNKSSAQEITQRDCLIMAMSVVGMAGYEVVDAYVNTICEGCATGYLSQRFAGISYADVAQVSCRGDIDLGIFDENGNLIQSDTSNQPYAVVESTPRWNGPFLTKIYLAEAPMSGGSCWYCYILFNK